MNTGPHAPSLTFPTLTIEVLDQLAAAARDDEMIGACAARIMRTLSPPHAHMPSQLSPESHETFPGEKKRPAGGALQPAQFFRSESKS